MPDGIHATLPLPGLSRVAGNPIIAGFDGESHASDDGLRALREVETQLGAAEGLAACACPTASLRGAPSIAGSADCVTTVCSSDAQPKHAMMGLPETGHRTDTAA